VFWIQLINKGAEKIDTLFFLHTIPLTSSLC
jgi:hypothetical protein